MKKIVLILADAGLELVPRKVWNHPSVRSSASRRGKRPGEILLDVSLHYSAMKMLEDREKRGRPDIVHTCLLMALSSLLNKRGLLQIYVHTYEGKVIWVNPLVRLPRNYLRFVGLMEQLLVESRVPPASDNPLLEVIDADLEGLVSSIEPSVVVLLNEEGEALDPLRLGTELASSDLPAVIVGAFQRGDFSDGVKSIASRRVSIAPIRMDSWAVVARVLCSVEDALGLYGTTGDVG